MRRPFRTLLADPDPAGADLVRGALDVARGEFEVTHAPDVKRLEQALREEPFDVAVCEIDMPGVGVGWLPRLIKELRPDLPLAIATDHGDEQAAVDAFECGALRYCVKTAAGLRRLPAFLRSAAEKSRDAAHLVSRERRMAKYVDIAGTMLVAIEADHTVSMVNRYACEVLGLPEDEIVGRDWFEHFLPESMREEVGKTFDAIIGGRVEPLREYSNPVLTADGEERLIAWRNTFVRDQEGRAVCVLGSGMDLTPLLETQQALRDSNERLQLATEVAGLIVWDWNPRTDEMVTLGNWRRFLAIDESDEAPCLFDQPIHPEDDSCIREYFLRHRRGEVPDRECEHRLRRGEGGWIWVRNTARAVEYDDQGRPTRVVGVLKDIDEQRNAEEKARESQELFRAAFDNAADAIALIDPETLRFINCNDKVFEGLGYTREEFEPRTFQDTNPQAPPGEFRRLIQAVLERGSHAVETRQVRRDGAERDVLLNCQAITLRGKTYVHSTWTDITERKRTERELLRSRESLARAQAVAQLGSWTLDFATDRVEFSEEMARIAGLEPEDRILTPDDILRRMVHPDDRPMISEKIRQVYAGRLSMVSLDYRMVRADGAERILHTEGHTLCNEKGEAVGMVGFGQDITDRLAAEEQARRHEQEMLHADKMITLGILVSGVAHEINNPNHFIYSHAAPLKSLWEGARPILDRYYEENGEFDLDGIPYSEARALAPTMFSAIEDGSVRIRNIVDELREYARERKPEEPDLVQMNSVVRSAVTLMANMITQSTERFSIRYDPHTPPVEGHYQRLEQVVINLVQNACQALRTPREAIEVVIEHDRETVSLSVRDEGVGIAEDDLEHVTDPFFTTKRDTGGTGLGLSISSSIVMDHGGRLEFEPRAPRGAIARMVLPRAREAEPLALEAPDGDDAASAAAAAHAAETRGSRKA